MNSLFSVSVKVTSCLVFYVCKSKTIRDKGKDGFVEIPQMLFIKSTLPGKAGKDCATTF
jgi:hypothetical protein